MEDREEDYSQKKQITKETHNRQEMCVSLVHAISMHAKCKQLVTRKGMLTKMPKFSSQLRVQDELTKLLNDDVVMMLNIDCHCQQITRVLRWGPFSLDQMMCKKFIISPFGLVSCKMINNLESCNSSSFLKFKVQRLQCYIALLLSNL